MRRSPLLFTALLGWATCFGQAQQDTAAPKLPPHIRLVPELKTTPQQRPVRPREQPNAPTVNERAAKCAHIITYVPSPKIDPGFVIGGGKNFGKDSTDKMNIGTPMPVCPEDVRKLPDVK